MSSTTETDGSSTASVGQDLTDDSGTLTTSVAFGALDVFTLSIIAANL
jgi:hypothetical protein